MTPDLIWLAWTAALTAVFWIPHIVGQVMTTGMITADRYCNPIPQVLPAWVKRMNRAHINAVESLAPFSVLVLIIHLAELSTETTAMLTMVFFLARLAHAVIFWLGIPFLRTAAFAVGLLATLGLFYQIVTALPVS